MQKTIFIVDDNVANLARAEEVLENHYLVITLSSAAKMFTVLEKVTPDLILLDIDMPDMDGLEAIKTLKENPKYADIPVIFLTGLIDSATEAYGIELGVTDFITKPFSEPVLLNRIKNQIEVGELMRERKEQIERLQNVLIRTAADIADIVNIEEANKRLDSKTAKIFCGIKNRLEAASVRHIKNTGWFHAHF